MTFSEEVDPPDPFASGRVLVPVPSYRFWSIRNVACEAANAEIRLASRSSVEHDVEPEASSATSPISPTSPMSPRTNEPTASFPTDRLISLAHFRIRQPNSKKLVEHCRNKDNHERPFLYKYGAENGVDVSRSRSARGCVCCSCKLANHVNPH